MKSNVEMIKFMLINISISNVSLLFGEEYHKENEKVNNNLEKKYLQRI